MALRAHLWRPILNQRRPELERLDTLRDWEKLSAEELRELQRVRLQKLLDHAYENVPYYRKQFSDRPVAADVSALPFTNKATLQNYFEELKSTDIDSRDWYENASGGSTGEPATFIQDSDYQVYNSAMQQLFDRWAGRDLSEPKIKIWGSERDLEGDQSLRTHIGRWLRNVTWINAYTLTDKESRKVVDEINKIRPTTIHAYVESISQLASFIENNGISVYSPESVMTTAGTLQPEMRDQIERVFECPVFNRYGSREFGTIASECPHQSGLHYCPGVHYVEIVDPNTGAVLDPGETGEITITSLTNYSMPLIRYRIGDIGSIRVEECDCGRKWPMLAEIQGRVTDHFVTTDGDLVFPAALRKSLHKLNWISKYQIHQTDHDRVVFRFVTSETPPNSDLDGIRDRAKRILGEETTVEFEFLEEIPPSNSGKFRHSISDVAGE